MTKPGLLKRVDAVTVPVPSLDQGIAFYVETLGHVVAWRDEAIGQAGLAPDARSDEKESRRLRRDAGLATQGGGSLS